MYNSGSITNSAVQLDTERLKNYIGGNTTLVAQGGGQRGIFTAGVLDAFLLSNFDPFYAFYGTSAGALNLCAFLCRQRGIGKSFIVELTTDAEFFHLFRYIRRKQYLGLDWALDKISDYPYRLDLDMGRKVLSNRNAFAAVTDAVNLSDHYLPMLQQDWRKVLVATCAIPRLYHQAVQFSHGEYVDGGVSASIPVQEAWRQGARCIVVIRTEGEVLATDAPDLGIEWLPDSFNSLQEHWQSKWVDWKQDWVSFLNQKRQQSEQQKATKIGTEVLNGGRWLFGADDIYRLSHLLGNTFDSQLADMLMVHYQTYSLTQDFLTMPPDDCFILQIKPDQPLRSSSLMSDKEALLYDYQLGVEAGFRFVETFSMIK